MVCALLSCMIPRLWQVSLHSMPLPCRGRLRTTEKNPHTVHGLRMQNSALRHVSETAPIITDYDSTAVHIIGHTDNQGATAYNQQLSQARAMAVARS
jgi:hypothetical protein